MKTKSKIFSTKQKNVLLCKPMSFRTFLPIDTLASKVARYDIGRKVKEIEDSTKLIYGQEKVLKDKKCFQK